MKEKERKCAFDEKRVCTKDCVARGSNCRYEPYCKRGKFTLELD